jgi:predicted nuclease of predicted toxin-antitoxin system
VRLLADENIPLETVRALRAAGHDVFSASEAASGKPDLFHVELAIPEERTIVTFDRDFGELAVRREARPEAGVLLLRFVPANPEEVTRVLVELFARPGIVWRAPSERVRRDPPQAAIVLSHLDARAVLETAPSLPPLSQQLDTRVGTIHGSIGRRW